MLSVARQNPQMAWHLSSATELPFDDGSFEVVICQQGLQYFPDRPAAVREMARVLVRGGRLALNVWGALDRQPGMRPIVEGIGDFLGRDAQAAFDLACSLNTSQELHRLAEDAGLRNVHVRFEHRTMRYPNAADYVAGFMGATPVTAQFVALPVEQRQAFIAQVAEQLAGYVDDAGLAVPWENHFVTAIK
jgi:SAM-dependent methyltransferase